MVPQVTANSISGGVDEVFNRSDSSGTFTPLQDPLGSTIALVNSSGSVSTTYSYDPFGNTSVSGSTATNPSQYTGRENEQNGLYYYRARYYSPVLGRFISEDPLGFEGSGSNFYGYVNDDPTDETDPSGLRDIIVVIWNRELSQKSVGHSMAMEMDGTLISNQFPDCACSHGNNTFPPWAWTLQKEGRPPDRIFIVHVPNDIAFNNVANNHKNKPIWDWMPTHENETNCSYAVGRALIAGGVPVTDNDWPGNLGDELNNLMRRHKASDPWNVSPGKLPDMNGK